MRYRNGAHQSRDREGAVRVRTHVWPETRPLPHGRGSDGNLHWLAGCTSGCHRVSDWYKEETAVSIQPAMHIRRSFLCVFAIALLSTAAFPGTGQGYIQQNLISDIPGVAPKTDPHLINPWGVAVNSNGSFAIANEDSGVV